MRLRLIASILLTALLTVTMPLSVFAQAVPSYSHYVALGDSVASGAGLGADLSQGCDRSSSAYPSLLAEKLGTSVQNVACSGAKVDEGIYGIQSVAGFGVSSQLDQAFANGIPDLTTLTIGANDVRWATFLGKCHSDECGTSFDKALSVAYRADLRIELSRALSIINDRSLGHPPKVLVTGYYNPISFGTCPVYERFTDAEISWLYEQKVYLNTSLKQVISNYNFAEFVPVDFSQHKLCSADSWVQGIDDAAPLHPTAAGQQYLADVLIKRLH